MSLHLCLIIQDEQVFDPEKYQQPHQQETQYRQPEYPTRNLTYSQKQALKDFDAYELKNLEIENRKLTVINDDLLKVNCLSSLLANYWHFTSMYRNDLPGLV